MPFFYYYFKYHLFYILTKECVHSVGILNTSKILQYTDFFPLKNIQQFQFLYTKILLHDNKQLHIY